MQDSHLIVTSLLSLARFLRDPHNRGDEMNGRLGTVVNLDTLSVLVEERARRAPSRVKASRVDAKPAPSSTRPGVKESFMTTIKRSLNSCVRGTEVERRLIVATLLRDAEYMAITVPFASLLVSDAFLHSMKKDSTDLEQLVLGEKMTPPSLKVYEEAMVAGLRREKTRGGDDDGDPDEGVNKKGLPLSPVMLASARFFKRNPDVKFPPRTPGDSYLIRRCCF